MKSVRKDDIKTTAKELGIKVGEKFVVLSPQDSYNNEAHACDLCETGDVVVFHYDDNTVCPRFENTRTGEKFYESFSCLARYKEGVVDGKMEDKELKLEVVKASFYPDYDVDDARACELELHNITFEQYRKLLSFIDTL